jgi:hypothetical protein
MARSNHTLRIARCAASLAGLLAGLVSLTVSAQEPKYTVLNPIGISPPIELKAMAPRPDSLAGKTIFLVDVTFNGGDLFLQEMQKWMAVNRPDIKTELRTKKGYYAADDPELWEEIQAVDGLMIMAIGH